MESYVVEDLRRAVLDRFPADPQRMGIFGHSMGGHGALTLALRHRELYRSVSAFAPIAAPCTARGARRPSATTWVMTSRAGRSMMPAN
jgi:S-formylglutathione hydrolase FrmB